ncbi:MAG TPA: hypothetical protein VN812_17940, partial [Candidatus Acidoferrales bacterium]|nr:hypothetical protein [Candidatus Acidoferrales bacterium]
MPSRLASLNDPTPHARLLSNGRYTVLLSGAGTGYSRWNDYALTSWSADRTEDRHGLFIYLRDLDRGALWSFGYQPVGARAEMYDAAYEAGRMSIERVDGAIEAQMDVCVTPDDDLEVRRLQLRNRSGETRRIEITTYAEIALNHPAAHAAHPAFSKLFVETEFIPHEGVLLAHRRPRSAHEAHPWMIHALIGTGAIECETDRARFVGRGRWLAAPAALVSAAPLSGATGSVLDPIFSLRRFVDLPPGRSAQLTLLLGVAPTRATVLACAARYRDPAMLDETFARAGEHDRAQLRRLGIGDDRAEHLQALAAAMLYGHPALRADVEVLRRARGGMSTLRKYGVDGGGLLVVAEVEFIDQRAGILDLAKAVAYWRTKALNVGGLVVCGGGTSLVDELRRGLAGSTGSAAAIVVRPRAEIPPADLDLIRAAADLVVHGAIPAFSHEGAASFESGADRAPAVRTGDAEVPPSSAEPLQFSNGCGGFGAVGDEYIIHLEPGSRPPMPWINVVANETFGFLVSESGAGYTWSRNSREHRLTPWSNDPITDPYGEALYIRDEDTGAVWSPLPGPVTDGAPHEVR